MLIIDNRASRADAVIVIGNDHLFISNKNSDHSDAAFNTLLQAKDDADIQQLLASSHIELSCIKKVSCNLHQNLVQVEYQRGKEMNSHNIRCQDNHNAEQLLSSLKTRLGFNEKRQQYKTLRAAVSPTLLLLVIAAATYGLYLMAQTVAQDPNMEITGRHASFKQLVVWLLELLGPNGVAALGGAVALYALWQLVQRIKQPPFMCILRPA